MEKFFRAVRRKIVYVWLRGVCRYSPWMAHLHSDVGAIPWTKKFQPNMQYHEPMDVMLITFADVSWVSVWTGTDVEILLHPNTETIVGVRIHGWKELLSHVKQ
jgi:hypothetical protein